MARLNPIGRAKLALTAAGPKGLGSPHFLLVNSQPPAALSGHYLGGVAQSELGPGPGA